MHGVRVSLSRCRAVKDRDEDLIERHEKCVVLNEEQESERVNQESEVVLRPTKCIMMIGKKEENDHNVKANYKL
jgi:hypothetical protein